MAIFSFHKVTLLAALALLSLSSTPTTSTVDAAPILSPRLIHAGTSDLAPGSALFTTSSQPVTASAGMRRRSRLHRREETKTIQGGGNVSTKIEGSVKGFLGLKVKGSAEAHARFGGGNQSTHDRKKGGNKKPSKRSGSKGHGSDKKKKKNKNK